MSLRDEVMKIAVGPGKSLDLMEVLPSRDVEYSIHPKTCFPVLKGFRWHGNFFEVEDAEMARVDEHTIQYQVPYSGLPGYFVIRYHQELLEWTLMGFQLEE